MSQFDELLNQVVSEDATADPPSGIERRILAALSGRTGPLRTKRRIWSEIAAAAILIGLSAAWIHLHPGTAQPVSAPAGHALVNSAPVIQMRPKGQELPVPIKSHAGRKVWIALPGTNPERRPQQKAIRVTSLEVDPLVIPSIEIASLTRNKSSKKGEVR